MIRIYVSNNTQESISCYVLWLICISSGSSIVHPHETLLLELFFNIVFWMKKNYDSSLRPDFWYQNLEKENGYASCMPLIRVLLWSCMRITVPCCLPIWLSQSQVKKEETDRVRHENPSSGLCMYTHMWPYATHEHTYTCTPNITQTTSF